LQEPFSKSKYFARTTFLQNGFSHHVPANPSQKWGQWPKRDIFAGTKNYKKKITGTKTKTRHIYRD